MSPVEFHEVARLVPHPMLLLADDGTILAANPAADERLSPPGERLAGRRLGDLCADPPGQLDEYLGQCAQSREPIPGALLLRGPDGKALELRSLGARASRGEPGILIHLEPEDTAARLSAEQSAHRLEELYDAAERARADADAANRAKDHFLSTLGHELRTPLMAILGWANILRTRRLDGVAMERALRTIERNAMTQVQLIEDILDVSRIVAGKLRLEIRAVDAAAIVRAALDVVRPSAEDKRVLIEASIADGVGTIAADPDRLQQIAWNLLSNAVKFTPKGGRIEVRLERLGAGVCLRVIDSGEGIAPEFLPHVFERFRQADGSGPRSRAGLGLGLAIVKHLVDLHEGTIVAESGGVGRGATFTVTLPAAPLSGVVPVSPPAHDLLTPPPLRLDGLRVVIVDDEPDARELVGAILEQQGAIVTVATSAADALRAVEHDRPHVFVSDIGMPDEDGYALLRKIRARTAARERPVPALALTAYAGEQHAQMAAQAGFQRHMVKPVVPAQLIDAVARLAGRAGAS
jgi:signal transduction histidine kinase/ActR/RegA family two-component response regulator